MAKSFSDLLNESIEGKVVLVRVDFNAPIKNGQVTDDTRLKSSLGTINALTARGAKVVLITHLKRPDGNVVDELRLNPIRDGLQQLLDQPVKKVDDCIGESVQSAINGLANSDILMLENIRFYKEEMDNDDHFAKTLASYADYFVQDAFGTVHRRHASTFGIAQHLPSFPGQLLDKEINYFRQILDHPKRPFTAIIGGSKISTKFSVLQRLLTVVDVMILGGAMVYTVLQAQGLSTGKSLVEPDLVDQARQFIEQAEAMGKTLYIPVDHQVVRAFDQVDTLTTIQSDQFQVEQIGVDIGAQSIADIEAFIDQSEMVFWNGPVGVFETPEYAVGTNAIAKKLAESEAITVVGGGDSIAALNQSGYINNIDHISTGGGASLEYLEGKLLPGIAVLT